MLAFLVIGYLNYHGIYPAETSLWLICLTCTLIFRFIISVIAQKYPDKNIYYVLLISSGFLLGGLLGGFYWSFFYEMTLFQRMILLLFFVGLTAGSTVSMAASPLAFTLFVLPIYVPILGRNYLIQLQSHKS